MKPSARILRLIAAGLLIAGLAASFADAAALPTVRPLQDAGSNDDRVTLNFKGGTVAEYLAALKQAAPRANVVFTAEVGGVPMPPVELRGANWHTAVQLVDEHTAWVDGVQTMVQVKRVPGDPMIYRVSVHRSPPRVEAVRSRVWTVRALLDQVKAPDLLSAIEAALAMQQSETEPRVAFHEATGLIIAQALPAQIEVIEEVIVQLSAGRPPASKPDAGLQLELEKRLVRLETLETERVNLMRRVDDAQRQMAQLQAELAAYKQRFGNLGGGAGGQ